MNAASIIAQLKPRLADLRAKTGPLARRFWKELTGAGVLLLVLAGPFLLRPADTTGPTRYDRRLVILTPHHESIRQEFGHAFTQHWKQKTGETLFIDWRVPGGTSDIAMLLKSEYTAAFQNLWEGAQGQAWSATAAQACLDGKLDLAADAEGKFTLAQQARKAFLGSTVGIGVDLFFGGGAYDFQSQARNGILVSSPPDKLAGLPKVAQDHPDWFSDSGIPEQVSGEPFRDKDSRWCGTCLSSFGIVFNRDVLRRLGVEKDPEQWEDLADPRLAGQIALADPGRSGSVAKAFEMLIQQQMQKALVRLTKEPKKLKTPAEIEAAAVRLGWREGLKLIQRISANARYFADASTKIPLEVARGDAAAGMCIDYFGRASAESLQRLYGKSRVGFIMPEGGTSIGVDPIGMLRGAKEPELATAFMEFVLSEKGQDLWSYRAGVPGGPRALALRRLPVRRDLYSAERLDFMSDGAEMPYEKAKAFQYHPEWTGPAFESIRFIIRVMCVENHPELRRTWEEMIRTGFTPRAVEVFQDVEFVRYDNAIGPIARILHSRDKLQEIRKAHELGDSFRKQYRLAIRHAQEGR